MDWFYHDPGTGRVGPLSADDLRNRYKERRIKLDTLVWRDGMREWQSLDRMGDELDLLSVKPDASRPPPLPPGPLSTPVVAAAPAYAAAAPAYAATGRLPPGYTMRPEPVRKGMSGCLIALLVVGALSIPVIGILAAVAIPAYQDYTIRAKLAQAVDMRAATLEPQIDAARARLGHCPQDPAQAGIGDATDVRVGQIDDGRCALEITVRGINAKVDGKTVLFAAPAPPATTWDCSGGDLPPRFRRPACRLAATESTP